MRRRMRVALLQDEVYVPNYYGSSKSNRMLMEALAKEGHECRAICGTTWYPTGAQRFEDEMARLRIGYRSDPTGVRNFHYRGVDVRLLPRFESDPVEPILAAELGAFRPDIVFVTSALGNAGLRSALASGARKTLFIAHGLNDLPFGRLADRVDAEYRKLLGRMSAVISVSRYHQDYCCRHGLDTVCCRFPVYGDGPFPVLGRFDTGSVTLVRAGPRKGTDVFIELARSFPDQEFSVVDCNMHARERKMLEALPNARIRAPEPDIEQILATTKIVLVPSIYPETFGLIVPEAMLRGIPVIASSLGGLAEAKLGVDYMLPLRELERRDGHWLPVEQNLGPWRRALGLLLSDRREYERCAAASRSAASRFVATVDVAPFLALMA